MIELACDESGYEGEHLVGGVTTVFVHASVRVGRAAADACVAELRERIRSPAVEYKANHLLRGKHRGARDWLLSADGPLAGAASVHLVDKAFFATLRLVQLLTERRSRPTWLAESAVRSEGTGPWEPAAVHREAVEQLSARWTAVLSAFDTMMRVRDAADLPAAARTFTEIVTTTSADGRTGDLLRTVARYVDHAVDVRRRFLDDPTTVPPLDPLVPAVRATVDRWSVTVPVTVVHDRQTALRPERVARIGGRLVDLRLVDSRTDARVQLADFLAGITGRVAGHALEGCAEPAATTALRPFVDPASLWADEPSGRALGVW